MEWQQVKMYKNGWKYMEMDKNGMVFDGSQ